MLGVRSVMILRWYGRHLGTQWGRRPSTRVPGGFILPKFGVYASVSRVDGRALYSVTYREKADGRIGLRVAGDLIPEYAGDLRQAGRGGAVAFYPARERNCRP